MNEAIRKMLGAYDCQTLSDYTSALREILQSIALLGLWRSKFFERGAFYGGTALRLLHGLDRFSEDLDFSLLQPDDTFDLEPYLRAVQTEMASFGFHVTVQRRQKRKQTAIESAFVKANTRQHLFVIEAGPGIANQLPENQVLNVRLEIDTDPPGRFGTETAYLLVPIPFSVRAYALPDLFAGKMHALLCRDWKGRVKGRDWYDLVWYITYHPAINLNHLEQRMRQSGHHTDSTPLGREDLMDRLATRIDGVDIEQMKAEVRPFLNEPAAVEVWSPEFFRAIVQRIET